MIGNLNTNNYKIINSPPVPQRVKKLFFIIKEEHDYGAGHEATHKAEHWAQNDAEDGDGVAARVRAGHGAELRGSHIHPQTIITHPFPSPVPAHRQPSP